MTKQSEPRRGSANAPTNAELLPCAILNHQPVCSREAALAYFPARLTPAIRPSVPLTNPATRLGFCVVSSADRVSPGKPLPARAGSLA